MIKSLLRLRPEVPHRLAVAAGGLLRGWSRQQERRLRAYSTSSNDCDPIFQLSASNLRFGPGATTEIGQDLREQYHCQRVVVFTDRTVRLLPCFGVLLESLERSRIEFSIFDSVRVEPNDTSFRQAIAYLSEQTYDGVVAMGGGSVLDTAKAANLFACFPVSDFYDYVNPPVGLGLPIPGSVKPLIAVPTTAGTGSETTGVAIFDDTATKSKTGIANRYLKPSLGIVDPVNTADQPTIVAKYTGLDVLCHALESYTALPSNQRSPRPSSPLHRPAYQGSNPVADVWSLFAIETVAHYLPRAVRDPTDTEARSQMLLASAAAGMGFGNAGVHLCHGMSYPVSSQVKSNYQGPYNETVDHPLIPHGLSVIVNAPAVFRFTQQADPDRHARCARLLRQARLGEGITTTTTTDLADEIRELCATLGVQTGLRQFGYCQDDIPSLTAGTLPQHRVTKISPRPVARSDLEALFAAALEE